MRCRSLDPWRAQFWTMSRVEPLVGDVWSSWDIWEDMEFMQHLAGMEFVQHLMGAREYDIEWFEYGLMALVKAAIQLI
jgi:hypothetical protein